MACTPLIGGGNCIIRDPTRRRHADSSLLMLQNPHNHAHKRTGIRQHGLVGHARKGTDFRNTLRIQRLDSALVRGRMLRNSDPCVRKTGLRGAVYTAADCPSDDRPPSQVGAVEGEGAPPGAGPLSGVGAPPGVGAGSGAPTRRTTRGSPVGWADPP